LTTYIILCETKGEVKCNFNRLLIMFTLNILLFSRGTEDMLSGIFWPFRSRTSSLGAGGRPTRTEWREAEVDRLRRS